MTHTSTSNELEELRDKRAKLEEESRSLKEEQMKLQEKAKALEEELSEELKNSNKTTRQAITQLESMIDELEQKLKQMPQTTEASKLSEETISKGFLKKCVNCGKEIPIASEECQHCGTKQKQNLEQTGQAMREAGETMLPEQEETVVTVANIEDPVTPQQEVGDDSKKANGKKKRFF